MRPVHMALMVVLEILEWWYLAVAVMRPGGVKPEQPVEEFVVEGM